MFKFLSQCFRVILLMTTVLSVENYRIFSVVIKCCRNITELFKKKLSKITDLHKTYRV